MVLNTEWAQVEVIDLINDGSGLAFGIIGGRSTGVVVKTILPGGVADRDGRLQSGDHILQIGEVNLRGLGSEQVASVLRQCGIHVRMVVARPVESTNADYQALGSHAPIVPTKILGDPVELDRHLIENGYAETSSHHPPSTYSTPYIYTGQHPDIHIHPISGAVDVVSRDPLPIGAVPAPISTGASSTTNKMLPLDMALHEPDLPETETCLVELTKDDLGLGITVAGYVCEKEEISGIFVKSISKGSAADLTKKIKVNDRIVEVNGVSVLGQTNHRAVEFLRNTGPVVKVKFERYLRGPKYEQLQQAIKANELRPSSPTSEGLTVSSLPKVPLSLVQMTYLGIEPEGESRTSLDFDSTILLETEPQPDGNENEDKEIVIDCRKSVQFSIASHESIYDKWKEKVADDVEIIIAQMHKESSSGLGISLEGTVDVEDGKEVRPHHYIRNILPDGPVGRNGILQAGDELLEVNGIQLMGLNHLEVVSILKQLPNFVSLVCARYPVPIRIIDTSQHREAFQARKIFAGSLQTLVPTNDRLVKAKSESSIASSFTSDVCNNGSRSRSLELIAGLPMWSNEPTIVELTKGDYGLGFSILDYQDPLNPQETVIVIRSLVPGGVAQLDGRLIPGDRLLAVNDVDVANANLDRAVQVLKGAPKGLVKITVAKPLNATDTISHTSQDTEEDQTCLEEFQECIEEYRECLEVVHICLDDDNSSFNRSASPSQISDLIMTPNDQNQLTNNDQTQSNHQQLKPRLSDENRNPSPTPAADRSNFLGIVITTTSGSDMIRPSGLTKDSIEDSDVDLSFKSTNDHYLLNNRNKCDNNVNFSDNSPVALQNDVSSSVTPVIAQSAAYILNKTDSLTQSDKDGYETCIDESLSDELPKTVSSCSKAEPVDESEPNVERVIIVQSSNVQILDEELTPTNSKFNISASIATTPLVCDLGQPAITTTIMATATTTPTSTALPCNATSEPCLVLDHKLQNKIVLDDDDECELKSYDNQSDSLGPDEFFLVQYPTPDTTQEVTKSYSEPSVLDTADFEIEGGPKKLTYRLMEYYNDYEDCLESYKVYSKRNSLIAVQEELSDEVIFNEICLPFRSRSAPAILDTSFVTMTYDPGPGDRIRRKSDYYGGRQNLEESEAPTFPMTIFRPTESTGEYNNVTVMEEEHTHVSEMLQKHWGSTHTVKVYRDPNKSLGISIVGGKVDIQPGDSSSDKVLGIFVKNVVPDSPAGKTGQFKSGDRILEVSGVDLTNATHSTAVDAIRNAPNPVTFVVQSLIPWNCENDDSSNNENNNCPSPFSSSFNFKAAAGVPQIKITKDKPDQNELGADQQITRPSSTSSTHDRVTTTPPPSANSPDNNNVPTSANDVPTTTNDDEQKSSAKDEQPENSASSVTLGDDEQSVVKTRASAVESDEESEDDDDEEDVRLLEGRTVTAKGVQIDRASAGNLRRTPEEVAADKEEEDDFGYTTRSEISKYGRAHLLDEKHTESLISSMNRITF